MRTKRTQRRAPKPDSRPNKLSRGLCPLFMCHHKIKTAFYRDSSASMEAGHSDKLHTTVTKLLEIGSRAILDLIPRQSRNWPPCSLELQPREKTIPWGHGTRTLLASGTGPTEGQEIKATAVPSTSLPRALGIAWAQNHPPRYFALVEFSHAWVETWCRRRSYQGFGESAKSKAASSSTLSEGLS